MAKKNGERFVRSVRQQTSRKRGISISDRIKVRHITRIFGVYVDQNHRGKGVGKKLLERALELIRQNKDIAKVQLMVNQEQEVAVELYKRIGFIVVGKLKKEIKVNDVFYDELVMEKMLLF